MLREYIAVRGVAEGREKKMTAAANHGTMPGGAYRKSSTADNAS